MKQSAHIVLVALSVSAAGPAQVFRVGPVYLESPKEIAAVVEIPQESYSGGARPEPRNFSFLEDGQPVATAREIKTVAESGKGVAIVVAVDVSGSMRTRSISLIKSALLPCVDRLGGHDQLALISFADDVRVESPFSGGTEQFRKTVNALRERGRSTVLYQALAQAFTLLDESGIPKHRRILVISDGKDEGSGTTLDEVIGRAKSASIPIDVAVVHTRVDPVFERSLASAATQTGGWLQTGAPPSLPGMVQSIFESVQQIPVVYFDRGATSAAEKTHSIGVALQVSGRSPEKQETAAAIPKTLVVKQQQPVMLSKTYVVGAVFAALLVIATMLLLWLRRKKPEPESGSREPDIPEPVPQRGHAVQDPPQPARRKTEVEQASTVFAAPKLGHATAFLEALTGPLQGRRFPIEKSSFRIGAQPDNDLPIGHDAYVSSHHARILYENGNLFLYDERSRNGTFLNDEVVTTRASNLRPGDLIRIGGSEFRLAEGNQLYQRQSADRMR